MNYDDVGAITLLHAFADSGEAKILATIASNKNPPIAAVQVYRSVLSKQPDGSVTIVTVGFLTNLASLLNSTGDQFSPLTGIELVKKKVKHLISMAGKFPSGSEFNVDRDIPASKKVIADWPTPIIFSGWDETAVLEVIRGWEKYYTLRAGRFIINDDGSNSWDEKGKGHFHLVKKMPVKEM